MSDYLPIIPGCIALYHGYGTVQEVEVESLLGDIFFMDNTRYKCFTGRSWRVKPAIKTDVDGEMVYLNAAPEKFLTRISGPKKPIFEEENITITIEGYLHDKIFFDELTKCIQGIKIVI